MIDQESSAYELAALVRRLEALVHKPDSLVRMELAAAHPGHYVVGNETGMLALGLECLKASSTDSADAAKALRRGPSPSLAHLTAGDVDRIGGLLLDDTLTYRVAPTAQELERKQRLGGLLFGLVMFAFGAMALLGFVATVHLLWQWLH